MAPVAKAFVPGLSDPEAEAEPAPRKLLDHFAPLTCLLKSSTGLFQDAPALLAALHAGDQRGCIRRTQALDFLHSQKVPLLPLHGQAQKE